MTPRVLFVGRGRLSLPLEPWLAKKWDALSEVFELHVLNAGTGGGDDRFTLLPPSAQAFYPRLSFAVATAIRAQRPDAIVASDPFVALGVRAGRSLARSRARLVVEVHGDPRTFTRGYGSPLRRTVAPFADAAARAGIRGADSTRALSKFTSSVVERARGLPATACFPTYSDLDAFAEAPLAPVPYEERLVFVGALEAYKNIDGLADAWRRVARERPQARLTIVGQGSRRAVVDRLVADLPGSVEHLPAVEPAGVIDALDSARGLVLPSFPEGLGRVVLEAFARARTVVATDAGGIPDIVTDQRDGLLVPPGDTGALVAAMTRVLDDHELAVRLGDAGRVTYAGWHQTPAGFAAAYRDLVDRSLAGAR
ncbi:MAG TPA: glycosyltransferase family 4 protein [Gaiellaceae bacterium]|nr:glycosyltransferase family 4 protein [Gaiellaceae bacterium]